MLLLPDYQIRDGSTLDRSALVKFLQRCYEELFPEQNYAHLAQTVDKYLSKDTPLWWVEFLGSPTEIASSSYRKDIHKKAGNFSSTIGCLWLGNAVDQVRGDRHAHIFLLYVVPEHRRRSVGKALMYHAEAWAVARGDRQIGLQVFQNNQPALNLYRQLGYQSQSLTMVKPLFPKPPA